MLWVDHLEIRLLLSRIKAVWGAMRQVCGVVVIVMVHEVQRGEEKCPVQRIYKKKQEVERRKRKEGDRRKGRRKKRKGLVRSL